MPIAFVGDTHFGRKAEHPTIKKHITEGQKKFFEWLVVDLRKRKISDIYFTGDIFDTRNSVNIQALIETRRLFMNDLRDFNITIVLGNHDMYFENSYDICSIEILSDLPNVTVVKDGIQTKNIFGRTMYIVPWVITDKMEEFSNFMLQITPYKKQNILFGHFEMMGIDMEGGNISSFGVTPNIFADAAGLVISGHYHGKSDKKIDGSDIMYLGSPYPLTFANSDTAHGYHVMNEDFSMEFIQNTLSPEFTTILDTDDLTKIGDLSNKFVRLYLNNSKTREEIFQIKTMIEGKKPLMHNIIPYKDGSIEVNKSASQRDANKLLNMDLISLSEIYIDSNTESLPVLTTHPDVKLAIMSRIREYNEKLTFKK